MAEPSEGLVFVEGLASDEVSAEEFKIWLQHGSKEIQ